MLEMMGQIAIVNFIYLRFTSHISRLTYIVCHLPAT